MMPQRDVDQTCTSTQREVKTARTRMFSFNRTGSCNCSNPNSDYLYDHEVSLFPDEILSFLEATTVLVNFKFKTTRRAYGELQGRTLGDAKFNFLRKTIPLTAYIKSISNKRLQPNTSRVPTVVSRISVGSVFSELNPSKKPRREEKIWRIFSVLWTECTSSIIAN